MPLLRQWRPRSQCLPGFFPCAQPRPLQRRPCPACLAPAAPPPARGPVQIGMCQAASSSSSRDRWQLRSATTKYLFRGNTSEPKSSKIDRGRLTAGRTECAPRRRCADAPLLRSPLARRGSSAVRRGSRGSSFGISQLSTCTCAGQNASSFGVRRHSTSGAVGEGAAAGGCGRPGGAGHAHRPPGRPRGLRWLSHQGLFHDFVRAPACICSQHTAPAQLARHHPCLYPPLALITTSAPRRGRCRPLLGRTQTSGLPE